MAASPVFNTALIFAAVAWPLAAGLAVVLWSKARARAHQRALAGIDLKVRELYRHAEEAPIPVRLAVTVEAVAEHEEMVAMANASQPKAKTRGGRVKTEAA